MDKTYQDWKAAALTLARQLGLLQHSKAAAEILASQGCPMELLTLREALGHDIPPEAQDKEGLVSVTDAGTEGKNDPYLVRLVALEDKAKKQEVRKYLKSLDLHNQHISTTRCVLPELVVSTAILKKVMNPVPKPKVQIKALEGLVYFDSKGQECTLLHCQPLNPIWKWLLIHKDIPDTPIWHTTSGIANTYLDGRNLVGVKTRPIQIVAPGEKYVDVNGNNCTVVGMGHEVSKLSNWFVRHEVKDTFSTFSIWHSSDGRVLEGEPEPEFAAAHLVRKIEDQ